ncbi:ABC superfamily ATP binding cassette transporter, abc protein [Bacillus sp. OxB-1]|uniref:ATP-binding cassette domain-containing protein n=1 Tax=Bacillus sp. (strain OxB-1) TaxID=98228 RepID=UPI0005823895|nr:ATP-binding cassette domain-containing protein [Bacillus sp. OxB-1]BAQ11028.1 ABC superfamily ATP binding cassette transporter, abc protein [Bacillus sp. OxB-1]
MSVLEAREVGKVIEGVPLLQSISFVCEAGQAIAVVGKNGSGKSTLLKILAGIHEPSRGHVIRQVKRVGYVPEQFPQNLRFKVKEYLRLVSTFHKMPNEIAELEIAKYAQLFGIGPYLQSPLQRVSKGTRQKVGIIQAMLAKPELLLLDEPLTGLDQTSQEQLLEILSTGQMAIIFTSHEEWFVRKLATHILQIETGEMITNRNQAQMVIRAWVPNKETLSGLTIRPVEMHGQNARWTVEVERSDRLLRELLERGCSILEVKERE